MMDQLHRAIAQQNWEQAAEILRPLCMGKIVHPSLLYNFGKVLIEQQTWAEAVVILTRTVAIAHENANAWFELGRAHLGCDDLPAAAKAFQRALELVPSDDDARRNLGRILLRLGHWLEAKCVWEPLKGDAEADLAIYRLAAETKDPTARTLREGLLQSHPNRAAVIQTLCRVSKGAIPLRL